MEYTPEQIAEHHKQLKKNNANMLKWDREREKKRVAFAKSEALKKKKGKSWAESHGQEEGKQLQGTITGKKFGPKSY